VSTRFVRGSSRRWVDEPAARIARWKLRFCNAVTECGRAWRIGDRPTNSVGFPVVFDSGTAANRGKRRLRTLDWLYVSKGMPLMGGT